MSVAVPSVSMMKRTAVLAVLGVSVLVAGCGGSDDAGTAAPPSGPATAAIPACADVVGQLPVGYAGSCRKADGSTLVSAGFDCRDGRKLWQFDVSGKQWWGFEGEAMHQSTTSHIADDPSYKAAYGACQRG